MSPDRTTDAELRALDIPLLLRYGLTLGGAHRTALFGDGAVAAALTVEELGVLPRAVAFLAEVVRRDGLRAAVGLPEPLPGPEAARTAEEWLTTASSVVKETDLENEEQVARWFEAVAAVLALRHSGAGSHSAPAPGGRAT
ncbi:hypothetical protein [Streptomyces qinglanensis]|uniref:Uncharacterized protein n=1 Tax=Streptomyces qinglanensis TaxID=943816 RepID=A0A1H9W1V6_9ACTN|nr:hypothetical protein [Streptomyces qinglanensis]SES27764.1 hypothetical protein SAMN05421870_114169 [Streptomyces qinglanensis]